MAKMKMKGRGTVVVGRSTALGTSATIVEHFTGRVVIHVSSGLVQVDMDPSTAGNSSHHHGGTMITAHMHNCTVHWEPVKERVTSPSAR